MSGIRMDRDTTGRAVEGRAAPRLAGVDLHGVLTNVFNCFALNALLVIACLPVVTIPVALWAATATLGRWREEGEPSVAREFLYTLRDARWRRVTVTVGVPLLATALAVVEILACSRQGTPPGFICLGLGAAAAFLCVAGSGYSVMLCLARPDLAPSDVWTTAVTLAVRNALGVSPLLVGEAILLALVLGRDPALCVVCLPLGFVALLRATAGRPVARLLAGPADAGPADAADGRDLSTIDSEEGV